MDGQILESDATSSSLSRLTGSQQRETAKVWMQISHLCTIKQKTSLLPSTTRCWEGHWVWSDGSTYDYTNWCSGEPNNACVENCGEININQISNRCWNDITCSNRIGFVCAKSL
ncbi:hypothetical protein G5714_010009 [Onychostoma macrolepis]|uniref:C-type lectin domain-containing protein n=1 Tax=Onychostoma macrolepis TaxID=369639 RepID=A0A7J6CP03_9TELE|nr:hypothetical protein G5714_010009 [Onychostoma macrolepis]